MNWESIIVTITLGISFGILVYDKFPSENIFFFQLLFFWNLNIVSTEDVLSGFSNKGLITIACLYIIVHPLSNNIYIYQLFQKLISKNLKKSLLRVTIIIGILSAFLNNTPLIQLITPIIRENSRKYHLPSSKFLMPISFASIIGGVSTHIGTSTNLVILSILGKNDIGFFDTSLLSIPFFGFFLLYNYFFLFLLPITSGLFHQIKKEKFIITIKCKENILLQHFKNEFEITDNDIVGILNDERDDISLSSIENYYLQTNESICILSDSNVIPTIIKNDKYFFKDCPIENISKHNNSFFECVIGHIKELSKNDFENKYNCKIIAHRNKKENFVTGDTILVLSNPNFEKNWKDTNDFFMISRFYHLDNNNKSILPIILFSIVIISSATGFYPIEKGSMTCVFFYLLFKIVSIHNMFKIINFNLLLIIGSSFGISNAVISSGLGYKITDIFYHIDNPWIIFFLLQVFTQILTEIINNNAVAAILTSIVIDISNVYHFNYKPFIIGLMFSCSCSFITPYGYATNLIIQGPGGYKWKDYFTFGIGLKLFSLGFSLFIPLLFPF